MAKRILAMQESDLRMSGDLAMNIQRVLPVTQADIDAAAAVGQGWVVEQVFEVSLPIDNTVGQTWRVIKVNSITPGQNVKRVMIVPNPHQRTIVVSGVPPLNLLGAVEDSLSSVKAYGGTEQRNIPQPYTQVNYVTNTASTAVDTGVMIDFAKNYEFEVECRAVSGSWYILQSRASSSGNITGIHGATSGSTITLVVGNVTVCTSAITRTVGNKLYVKATLNNGTATLYVKDETANTEDTKTGSYGTSQPNPTAAVYLLGNAGGQYADVNSDIYMARIKENDTVVMDYVPARQVATAGFYDKASGTFKTALTPENLSADGNTEPTPDAPMNIVCNNGALKILDKSDWTIFTNPTSVPGQGVFISSAGKWTTIDDSSAGVAIPLTIGKQYTLVIHKKTIGLGTTLRFGQSPQATPTAAGVQLTDWYRGTIADGQMVSFVAKLPYLVMQLARAFIEAGGVDEAIEVLEAQGAVETINVHTKNLLDPSKGEYNTTRQYRWYYSDGYTLKAGKTYTLSCDGNVTVYIMKKSDNTSLATGTDKTTYAPTEDIVVYFRIYKSGSLPETFNAQLEIGNTATAYEPYYDGGTAGVANLFKIDNYVDTQEILTGLINHQLGIYVLDGTETWKAESTSSSSYCLGKETIGSDSTVLPIKSEDLLCSHYPIKPTEGASTLQDIVWVGGSNVNFKVRTTYATLVAWKSYLAAQYSAGTPVILVYPLATAQDEVAPVPQTMQTVAGDNVLDIVQAGMSGLEVSATYTAGVSVTITEIENANIGNDVDVVIA